MLRNNTATRGEATSATSAMFTSWLLTVAGAFAVWYVSDWLLP